MVFLLLPVVISVHLLMQLSVENFLGDIDLRPNVLGQLAVKGGGVTKKSAKFCK